MTFKYFDKPEILSGLEYEEMICDICSQEKLCFGATNFYGTEELTAICPDCLGNGGLIDRDVSSCSAPIRLLEQQLRDLNPDLSDAEIEAIAKQKTLELEKMTPHLVTWQDFTWPCLDGDYCKFIGFGSKQLYRALAKWQDAKFFFKNSLEEGYIYNEDLWNEDMQDNVINSSEESCNNFVIFYVFQSLNSDKIVTLYDFD